MNKNRKRLYLSLGIVCAVFTVLAFTLPFARGAAFWIAYCFGILAVGVQAYVLPKAFAQGEGARSKFYGFPIARVGAVYAAAQVVLSLVFMALAGVGPAWLWRLGLALFVLLLGAAALGFITTDAIRDEVERQDAKLKTDVSRMRALQTATAALRDQCDDPAAKDALGKLADAFRFSDPVSGEATAAIESDLASCVDELQCALTEGDYASVTALCGRIQPVLAQRNQLCKGAK